MTAPVAPVYYPLMLDLRGRLCLVVGGGEVARRKVKGLLAAGAVVTVVAPTALAMPEGVTVIRRTFQPHDLDHIWLVIAAVNDAQINQKVAAAATARHIWVNVVDDPACCTAILPAVVRHGLFCLAISTSGASPVWARRIRDTLAAQYGPEYGELAEALWMARQHWKAPSARLTPAQRRQAWEAVLDLPLLELIIHGQQAEVQSTIHRCMERSVAGAAIIPSGEEGA